MLRRANLETGEFYGRLPAADAEAAVATGLFDAHAGVPGFSERTYVRERSGLGTLDLAMVPREYTELLGVRPLLGRSFTPADDGTRAVLLSYRTWMRNYGGSQGVVDSLIQTPARGPLHIIGVLHPQFRNPVVSGADGLTLLDGAFDGAPLLVRLKRGTTTTAAQAQLNATRREKSQPAIGFRLVPLREEMAGRQDQVLWLLLGASAIVLLVACVNLGNLIAARGLARAREFAVRAALGGSRARLVRLLLVESGCIALFGTAAGLCLAYWGFRVLSGQLPPVLAAVTDPAFDARALVFAVVTASAAAVAFGVAPAWRLSRADARDGLRLGQLQSHAPRRGRQTPGRARSRDLRHAAGRREPDRAEPDDAPVPGSGLPVPPRRRELRSAGDDGDDAEFHAARCRGACGIHPGPPPRSA